MSTLTPNLLRPEQVASTREELARLQYTIQQPHAQNKRDIARQIKSLSRTLEELTPQPFTSAQVDAAHKRLTFLKEQILAGMPTQEEMRKAPPGAVSKHMEWERRNKRNIAEYKYLALRMNAGNPDNDVANIERFRPARASHELNMDNALIPGKDYWLPTGEIDPESVMSDAEADILRTLNPEMHDQMVVLSPSERAAVLSRVREYMKVAAEEVRAETADALNRKAIGQHLTEARRAAKARKQAETLVDEAQVNGAS